MAKWYVIRGGVELGPFENKELKELASSGKVKSEDSIRREDMPKACKASSVKGLFTVESKATASDLDVGESAPTPIDDPTTFETNYRAANPVGTETGDTPKTSFKETAIAAARLGSAQAERAKLSNVTMPQLYMALGKHCLAAPEFQKEFGERIIKLNQVQSELAQLKNQPAATTSTISEKAKAAAEYAVRSTQSAKLSMQQASHLSALGKAVYDKYGESSGPDTLTSPILNATVKIRSLQEEISSLSKIGNGSWITAKSLLATALFLTIAFTLYLGMRTANLNGRVTATNKSIGAVNGKNVITEAFFPIDTNLKRSFHTRSERSVLEGNSWEWSEWSWSQWKRLTSVWEGKSLFDKRVKYSAKLSKDIGTKYRETGTGREDDYLITPTGFFREEYVGDKQDLVCQNLIAKIGSAVGDSWSTEIPMHKRLYTSTFTKMEVTNGIKCAVISVKWDDRMEKFWFGENIGVVRIAKYLLKKNQWEPYFERCYSELVHVLPLDSEKN